MTAISDIVQKLWSHCHALPDDGIAYHECVSELRRSVCPFTPGGEQTVLVDRADELVATVARALAGADASARQVSCLVLAAAFRGELSAGCAT